jgi:hypothetical protein
MQESTSVSGRAPLSQPASRNITRFARAAVVLAVSLAYFGYVFQVHRPTLMTSGLSEWLDPYLLNVFAEHWYHTLLTLGDPSSPVMFFPKTGTIGYSTSLVLFAPFYVLVRPFLHPFTAYTVSLFVVVETGVLCLYVLFRKFLDLKFLEALLLTAFFASSLNVINSWHTNVWSQTLSIFLVPPILLLTLASGRVHQPHLRAAIAGTSGCLATLLFAQDFYTGWFVLLLSTLLGLGAAAAVNRRWLGEQLSRAWRADRPRIVAFMPGALIGALVFVWFYGRAYLEHPAFPEEQLMSALLPVRIADWSGPIDAVRHLVTYAGVRSFQLVFLVGALMWMPWFKVPLRIRLFGLWFLLVSTLVVILGAVKFDEYLGWRNYSVWKRLFLHLPGFDAIRDPKRIIYTYELLVVLLTGVFLAQLPRRSVLRAGVAVLAFALLMAEPNREAFTFGRPQAVFDRWVNEPIAIDASCRSFFMLPASRDYESRYVNLAIYNLDAAFIAFKHSLPTLNGYSAWAPAGWSIAQPWHPGYLDAVDAWAATHRLSGICQLDIDARRMTPYVPASRTPQGFQP